MFAKITRGTTIEVQNLKMLLFAWRTYDRSLIARYLVREPLTEKQLSKLPAGLRERVEYPAVAAARGVCAKILPFIVPRMHL
jgi:hypothetical protein